MVQPGTYRLVRDRPTPLPRPVLDECQQRVVDHAGGPLLVLAGPGTGKTTTLVEAVAERVRRGARPDEVLVLTFSRRAADELRDRIGRRLGGAVSAPAAWTFHGWCWALVAAHADACEPPPRLLSGAERLARIRDLLAGSLAGEGSVRWPPALRAALSTRGFAREVADALDRARERGLDPDDLRRQAAVAGRAEWAALADFYDEFVNVLAARGEMDYPELVRRALGLLDDAGVLAEVRRRHRAVFVDEYQDTDPAQEALLRLLAGGGADLVVMGDPDQSIYAFRGADVACLLEFPNRFRTVTGAPAPVVALRTTRRGGPALVAASRAVADRIPAPGLASRLRRAHRALVTAASSAPAEQVEIQVLASASDEAAAIADVLRREHLERGTPWESMAVLVRAAVSALPRLRHALLTADVPVAVAADEVPVAGEPAVAPLLAALGAAAAPDGLSADGARLLLTSGLGAATAAHARRLGRALRAAARAGSPDAPPAASDALVRNALLEPGSLVSIDDRLAAPARRVAAALAAARQALAAGDGAEEALWRIWEATDWPSRLAAAAAAGGPEGRAADRDLDAVVALFDAVATLSQRVPRISVPVLLDELEGQEIPSADRVEGRLVGAGVRLLTAHRSKGLEWDVVVVAGAQEGVWPDLRRRGAVLEADRVAAGGARGPLPTAALLAEERRLFYVAVTRARRRLLVTAVANDDAGERPSRFLSELGVPVPECPSPPPEALASAPALVGRLRAALTDPATSPALRAVAASQLARLAASGPAGRPWVPAASPDAWWGVCDWSTGAQPVRPADRPVVLSASSVARYDRCPLAWFLEHEAAGATPPRAAAAVGTVLHAMAQRIATGSLAPGPEALEASLEEMWHGLAFEARWQRDREWRLARDALARFLAWQEASGRRHVASEAPFDLTVAGSAGEVRVRGAVDRLDRDPDGRLHVVDLKTGTRAPTDAAAASDPQLRIYQLAVGAGACGGQGGERVDLGGAELVHLRGARADGRPRVQRQPPLDDGERSRAAALLDRVAAGVLAEQFPARPNDRCESCAYARCCPARQEGREVPA